MLFLFLWWIFSWHNNQIDNIGILGETFLLQKNVEFIIFALYLLFIIVVVRQILGN